MTKLKKSMKLSWLVPLLITLGYLATHLYRLNILPVFADEAIYLRWAQLIIDDWRQYLFFPLNDGKGPLFFWLLAPWQFVFNNQLFAGRFVSVLLGLLQIFSLKALVKVLGGERPAQWLAMLLGASLPFWYFHHRLVLTDVLLTLALTWAITGILQLIKAKPGNKLRWSLITGLSLGVALWTKLPAVLFMPIILFLGSQTENKGKLDRQNLIWSLLSVTIGGLIFASLKLHPAFSQLFGRGSDFLFPWREVLFQGKWRETIINIPTYLDYFGQYFTWLVLILSLVGLFLPTRELRHKQRLLWISALIFTAPIALLGRVVYPRYFFPLSIFVTSSAALAAQQSWQLANSKKLKKNLGKILKIALCLALGWSLFQASRFIYTALTNPAQLALVKADQEQYLYKWSAGYGIKPSVDYIQQLAETQSVAVATEGSFGTLPDGALLYLHRTNVDNIYLEGIGYPVKGLTTQFISRAHDFKRVFLLVNSHRLELDLPLERLSKEYCRPAHAPCLQLWEITGLVDQLPIVEK